jgi:hypothetical protein
MFVEGNANIITINKDTEALWDVSKDVGPKVNPQEAKCMLMSCSQK